MKGNSCSGLLQTPTIAGAVIVIVHRQLGPNLHVPPNCSLAKKLQLHSIGDYFGRTSASGCIRGEHVGDGSPHYSS